MVVSRWLFPAGVEVRGTHPFANCAKGWGSLFSGAAKVGRPAGGKELNLTAEYAEDAEEKRSKLFRGPWYPPFRKLRERMGHPLQWRSKGGAPGSSSTSSCLRSPAISRSIGRDEPDGSV